MSATWTEADGVWSVSRNVDAGVSLSFSQASPGSSFWNLHFASDDGLELEPGLYLDAQRWPFQDPGHPGLSVSGEGRGCNTLTGEFTVTSAVYDYYGVPAVYAASFEQHCEGAVPALHGTIDYSLDVGPLGPAPDSVLVAFGNLIYELSPVGEVLGLIPVLESDGTPPSATEDARDLVRSTGSTRRPPPRSARWCSTPGCGASRSTPRARSSVPPGTATSTASTPRG
jgi:hypothetical protein